SIPAAAAARGLPAGRQHSTLHSITAPKSRPRAYQIVIWSKCSNVGGIGSPTLAIRECSVDISHRAAWRPRTLSRPWRATSWGVTRPICLTRADGGHLAGCELVARATNRVAAKGSDARHGSKSLDRTA